MAMLGVAFQPSPRPPRVEPSPAPSLGPDVHQQGKRLPLELVSHVPAVLRAGPRRVLLFAAAVTTGQPGGTWGPGRFCARTAPLPASDTASSQRPWDWSPCPAPPQPCPSQSRSSPPAVTSQDPSACLSYTRRAGSMMAESQGPDPSAGPVPSYVETSPHFYPLSSPLLSRLRLPGVPDLGRRTLPSGFWRQEAFNRKQLEARGSLLPSCPTWECHREGGLGAHSLGPLSGGWQAGKLIQRGPWEQTHSVPENIQLLNKP